MAKPPWARLTKPIKPIVTERPTDTMKSTMPPATPPRTMLATSMPKITSSAVGSGNYATSPPRERLVWSSRRNGSAAQPSLGGAGPDLLFLACVLHGVDLAKNLLEEAAVFHHHLGHILVHDDVASVGIDHDRAARTVELPALERGQRLVGFDLAFERLDDVDDRGHAVVAADGKEVRRRVSAILLPPGRNEALVLGVVEIRVVVVHGDEADCGRAHGLELGVLSDVAGADQLDAGLAQAERGVGLDRRRGVVAGRDEDEEHVRFLVLGALEEGREVGYRAGAAHRDPVDHLAAIPLEGALERGQAVLARREVGVAD